MSAAYRVCSCGEAFYPRFASHRLCPSCWRRRSARRQQRQLTEEATTPDLMGVLRAAAALCHPDRHPPERRRQATRTTQDLLELLAREKRP